MDCSINNLWKSVKSHRILMIGKGLESGGTSILYHSLMKINLSLHKTGFVDSQFPTTKEFAFVIFAVTGQDGCIVHPLSCRH